MSQELAINRIIEFFNKDIYREHSRLVYVDKTYSHKTSIAYKRIIIKRRMHELGIMDDAIQLKEYSPGLPIVACTEKEISDHAEKEIPLYGDEFDSDRIQDRKTLRIQLNKARRRGLAAIALHLGIVGGRTGNKRVTSAERDARLQKNKDSARFIASHQMTGSNGESFKLVDAGFTKRKSVSELYCILKGIESHAEAYGMSWAMVVVTLPPEYHPNPTRGSSSWNGVLPDQARKRISHGFTRIQDRCRKNKISIAGFWTIESHQNACPHANFMLYYDSGSVADIQQFFDDEFYITDKSIEFVQGSKEEGSATFSSYCMKYITKYFADAEDTAILEEQAWASAWQIRRIGFFGTPSRVQWRSFRASATPPEYDPLLKRMWLAARGGRFGEYIGLAGGLNVRQSQRPIRTVSQPSTSGRSRIAVGVENIKTEMTFITKKVGYWSINKIEQAMEILEDAFETATNGISRVSLSCPSLAASGAVDPPFVATGLAIISHDPPF